MTTVINSGDTAFILICSAFVFVMTPALAFFYGGMMGRKNVLNTMLSSFLLCGLGSLLWVVIGYSISFGSDIKGIVGGLNYALFNGVSAAEPFPGLTISNMLFAAFQMMFAIITPALITGSLVGRMKFNALVWFTGLWSLLVYYPLAHMVWGGGFIGATLGALDFAGGNVVHISSGVSGLIACIILGKRRGHGMISYKPHNIPFVLLGAALLWFGWFGFNAGSALGANDIAVHAFVTTNTAAAVAMLSWMFMEKMLHGKPTVLGAATGAVVGLVAITPGAGFVPVWASILIGAVVSPLCYFFMAVIKEKFGYDDALDAFGCHGIGGIWGGIATGLFASSTVNPIVKNNGLFFGGSLLNAQLISIVITIALAAVMTALIMGALKLFMNIRVTQAEEANGLDIAEHRESAYPSFMGLD